MRTRDLPVVCRSDDEEMNRDRRDLLKSGMLLLVTLALLVGFAAICLRTCLRRANFSSAREGLLGKFDASQYCGTLEEDTEFHTGLSLRRVDRIYSAERCCAACDADSECKAWSWGQRKGVSGISNSCYLKQLESGERVARVHRLGIVSGFLLHRLESNGIENGNSTTESPKGLTNILPREGLQNILANETCRGEFSLEGHGRIQVVNALWHTPHAPSRRVDVLDSWVVFPHLRSRAYFAEACSPGVYKNYEYSNIHLLGRTIRYTTDVSGVGCGCNAQLHLIPMRDNPVESECHDFVCGPLQKHVCGETCGAVRIQDANQYAWSTSLHLKDDPVGVSLGYGGGAVSAGRRDWNASQYGPGAACIDTSWPFDVSVSFPVNDQGVLDALELVLSQPNRVCNLTRRIDKYSFKGRNGMAETSAMLDKGVTPAIGYWSSDRMQWLDGTGKDGRGPCASDFPKACPESMRFYEFLVQWSSAVPSDASSLSVAMSAIHDKLLPPRSSKEDSARLAAKEPCEEQGREPAGTPQAAALIDPNTEKEQPGQNTSEVVMDNTEWEVVFSKVPVRKLPHTKAEILSYKVEGEILVGPRTGNWLRLLRQPGFVAIQTFLKERHVTYKRLRGGSCAEAGMFIIEDHETCEAAAFALGYLDAYVNVYDAKDTRPYGCYLMDGQLFFVSNKDNKKNGVGDRLCICSSVPYPAPRLASAVT